MATTTVTSKGQLTIPKRIRVQLDLREGDQVVVSTDGDQITLVPVRRRGLLALRGVFAGLQPYPGREVEREAAISEAAREALGWPEE